MLTPQDVQKASFDRVAFGGYNMQQVDAFLQPLDVYKRQRRGRPH